MSRFENTSKRNESLIRLALWLGILVAFNVLAGLFVFQLDLTQDKRYTLTPATKKLLKSLDREVVIEIYLEGEYPALFKRLQTATREKLQEYRGISSNIEFNFINPLEGKPEAIQEKQKQLNELGMYPVNLNMGTSSEVKRQLIYPYALVTYGTRPPFVINLLENQIAGASQEQIINNSINLLEYKFSNAIQKLLFNRKPIVAFTTGHGELDSLSTVEFKRALLEFAQVGDININARPSINYYGKEDTVEVDVLVIAKPIAPFSEQEKFKIDQFVMNGGKVLWLLDKTNAGMDSLAGGTRAFVAMEASQNLDDQLFKYGVRVNPDLILDLQASKIPVVVGMLDNQPQIELKPWFYFSLLFAQNSNHPIVKSLDGVDTRFPTTIDTIKTKTPVTKTVLLSSSQYSRIQRPPVRLSMDFSEIDIKPEKFNKPFLPVAVLLEGTFPSLFQNRVPPEMREQLEKELGMTFQEFSKPTKMIVVADGDIARNDVDPRSMTPLPLGFNRFENYTYGNKDFLLNCVEYLLDQNGVVAARSKDFKLRLLNKVKANDEKVKWQIINIVLPLVFLAIFGLVFSYIRKRKYAK